MARQKLDKKNYFFSSFLGVPMYNMQDGYSYICSSGTFSTSGSNYWQRNAYTYEGISFDSCNGHPDGRSSYHNHIDPTCLYTKNSSAHSPIIGGFFISFLLLIIPFKKLVSNLLCLLKKRLDV